MTTHNVSAKGSAVKIFSAISSTLVLASFLFIGLSGEASATTVLTVSGITASNKVYDGNTSATLNTASATLVGVTPGEVVYIVATSSATGTFSSKTVATGKTVTIASSSMTLGGTDAAKYELDANPTTTADITAKPLTVTGITASNKTYNGNTSATLVTASATLSGVVPGDVVSITATSSATGTFSSKTVATGKTVTVATSSMALSGGDAGNYALVTNPTTTANISAVTLTVTGITASDRGYDSTTIATLYTSGAALVGIVGSDDVSIVATSSAVGNFDDTNPGRNKTVTVSGLTVGGTDGGNYLITQPTTTATIYEFGAAQVGLPPAAADTSVTPAVVVSSPVVQLDTTPAAPVASPVAIQVSGGTAFKATLKMGMQNDQVRALQTFLAQKGFFKVTPTGYFGTITTKGIKAYQKSVKITPNGLFGPLTKASVNKELNN